jgi:hypothetical protein
VVSCEWIDSDEEISLVMEVTGKSFGIFRLTPSLPPTRRFCTTLLLAKKKDIQDNKNESQPQQPPFLSFSVSNSNLARAAIGIFALGFIDAGLVLFNSLL